MSLKSNYDDFENMMHKNGSEEELGDKFEAILEEAFQILNKKIDNEEFLDITKEEELYTVRAMFDYMIELWSENHFDEAKTLAFDLAYLVDDDKLKEMFGFFALGIIAKLDIDEFLEKYVNLEDIEEGYDFFLTSFKDEIEELIIKYKDEFVKEFNK